MQNRTNKSSFTNLADELLLSIYKQIHECKDMTALTAAGAKHLGPDSYQNCRVDLKGRYIDEAFVLRFFDKHQPLSKISYLSLMNATLSGIDAMAFFKKLPHTLTTLDIRGFEPEEEDPTLPLWEKLNNKKKRYDYADLQRLENLTTLLMDRPSLNNISIQAIASLPKLEALFLSDTNWSGIQLEPLVKMKNLKVLSLSRAQNLPYEQVVFLSRIPSLQYLDFTGSKLPQTYVLKALLEGNASPSIKKIDLTGTLEQGQLSKSLYEQFPSKTVYGTLFSPAPESK